MGSDNCAIQIAVVQEWRNSINTGPAVHENVYGIKVSQTKLIWLCTQNHGFRLLVVLGRNSHWVWFPRFYKQCCCFSRCIRYVTPKSIYLIVKAETKWAGAHRTASVVTRSASRSWDRHSQLSWSLAHAHTVTEPPSFMKPAEWVSLAAGKGRSDTQAGG